MIVDVNTARSDVQQFGINASYTLTEIATGKAVATGTTTARVSYDNPGQQQRFANARGQRDAENRAAKVIADRYQGAAGILFRRRHVKQRSTHPASSPGLTRRSRLERLERNSPGRGMVALKTSEVDAFVARPSTDRPIVLLCGPDAGLVHERAEKIINASVDDPRDPFALVRIEGDALASEPSRLVEEAHTVPLFGGRRAVWIKAGSRPFPAAVEAVVASPPTDCRIVIEAGDLKRTSPVRAVCEKAKCAVVLPCYPDTERDLARLIDDEMRDAGLAIAPDARAALVSLIGGDRQGSRSEIRKLALYAHGRDRVVLEDVIAVVTDASALGLDDVIDAAFAGRTAETESQFSKALAAGTSSGTILSWARALRHPASQGAARPRCRREQLRRDAKLHPAGPFPPHRRGGGRAAELDRAAAAARHGAARGHGLQHAAHHRAFGCAGPARAARRSPSRPAAASGDFGASSAPGLALG